MEKCLKHIGRQVSDSYIATGLIIYLQEMMHMKEMIEQIF